MAEKTRLLNNDLANVQRSNKCISTEPVMNETRKYTKIHCISFGREKQKEKTWRR